MAGTSRSEHRLSRDQLKSELDKLQEQQQNSSKTGKSSTLPFSNVISKRDNRASLPVFAGSVAHTSVLTANAGEDVDFVVGLSENLLVECRRLQSENEKKSTKLKQLDSDYERLKLDHAKLNSRLELVSKEEDSLKDTNWELEMKIHSLSQDFQKLNNEFNKNKIELEKQKELTSEVKTELEEATLEKTGLIQEVGTIKQHYHSELKSLKDHVNELNEENEELHGKLGNLTSQVKYLNSERGRKEQIAGPHSVAVPNKILTPGEHRANHLGTEFQNSEILESANVPDLENEALRVNLEHANDTIIKLKERLSLFELSDRRSSKNDAKKDKTTENALVFNNEYTPSRNGNTDNDSKSMLAFETPSKSFTYNFSSPQTEQSAKMSNVSDYDTHSYTSDVLDSSRKPLSLDMAPENGITVEIRREDVENYAKLHNIVLVPDQQYKELKDASMLKLHGKDKEQYLPTEGQLISKLTTSGYVVKTKDEYEKIAAYAKLYENPSEDYISTILSSRQKLSIDNSQLLEFERFKRIAEDPSLSFLEEKARLHSHLVVAEEKYEDMIRKLGLPPIEWLKSLDETQTKLLIEDISKIENSVFISNIEYAGLLERAKSPELETVERIAGINGQKLITVQEFRELKQITDAPTLSHLREKAADLDHVLISRNDYESMQNERNNPSEVYLSSQAGRLGFKLIVQHELERLNSLVMSPSLDELKEKLQLYDQVAIPKSEHLDLISIKDSPSFNFLQEKAKPLGYDLVSTPEHKELLRKSLDPSIKEMQEMATSTGHLVVIKEEYESLTKLVSNPPKDFLAQKAANMDLFVVEKSEYQNLLDRCSQNDLILESVRNIGYEPIEIAELASLKNSSISSASVEDVKQRLDAIGFIAVRKEQFAELSKPIVELASLEETVKLCERYHLVALAQPEFKALKKGSEKAILSESELITLVQDHGYSVLDTETYEKLKVEAQDPSIGHLEECASRLKMSLVESSYLEVLRKAIESPTIDYLEEQARVYHMKVVPSSDLIEMEAKIRSPEKIYLEEQAVKFGLSLISRERITELESSLDSPSLGYLSEKANILGHSLLSKSDYDGMLKDLNEPSREKLANDAAKMQLHIVSASEYEEFNSLLKVPNFEVLNSVSGKIGCKVISTEEYASLKSTNEVPTLEFLETKAKTHKKVLIDEEQWQSINAVMESPQKSYLLSKATELGLTLLPLEQYENLLYSSKNPTVEMVEMWAKSNDMVLVEKSEHQTLICRSQSCGVEEIKKYAAENGEELIEREELKKLKEYFNNPSLDFLKEKATAFNMHVVPSSGYNDFSEISLDQLREIASKLDQVTLDLDTYNSLVNSSQNMTKQSLSDLCSKFGLKAINEDKYQRLAYPTNEDISKHAESLGFSILKTEELNMLRANVESPSEDTIFKASSQHGYKLVKNHEYEALVAKASKTDSFSKSDLISMASKVGLVALTEEVYNGLVFSSKAAGELSTNSPKSKVAASKLYFENVIKQENSDKNIILESGKTLGFVRISYDEYKKLLDNQQRRDLTKTDVYNGAKVFDLTVLPSGDYKNLLKKRAIRDTFTLEDVEAFALSINMKLVPLEQIDAGSQLETSTSKGCTEEVKLERDSIPLNSGLKDVKVSPPSLNVTRSESTSSFSSSATDETHYYDAEQSNNRISVHDNPSTMSIDTTSTHYTDANDFIDTDNVSIASTIKDEDLMLETLEKRAELLGFRLVALSQHPSKLSFSEESSFEASASEEMIYSCAHKFGLSVLPMETYAALEHLFADNGLNLQSLSTPSTHMDLTLLRKEEYEKMVSINDADEILSKYNAENGTLLVSKNEYEKLRSDAQVVKTTIPVPVPVPILTKETIKQRARELGYVPVATEDYLKLIKPDNVDDIKEKAAKLGVIAMTEEEVDEIKKPVTKDVIEAKAAEYDLVVLPTIEYSLLKKPLTESELKIKCAEQNLIAVDKESYDIAIKPIDENSVKQWADNTNNIVVPKLEYDHLLEIEEQLAENLERTTSPPPITKEQLIEKAREFDLIAIQIDKFEEIQHDLASSNRDNLSKEDVISLAKGFGFAAVPVGQMDSEVEASYLSEEKLIETAHNFGLVPIPVEQFEQIKRELGRPVLTREQIVEHAAEFDLIAIDLLEYKRLKKGSYMLDEEESGDEEAEEDEYSGDYLANDSEFRQLTTTAKRFGLLCIPESAFVATSNAQSPDVKNVVVLPIKYYNGLVHQEAENWSKVPDEELQAEARRRGFNVGVHLRKDFENSPLIGHKRNTSWSARSTSSDDPRKSLSEAAVNAALVEMELQTRSRATSRSSSMKRPPPSVQTNQISAMTHSDSVATGLSLPTMASLSEPSIIPALTQTMIGEYLHKYYRRLGPFTNSSRHERYFWVHPYTLTLYWSTSNPVLENPGNNKTRAAAIIGVESVEDPNPYPLGLYPKSIIVKTESRDIKITCPTRQRHNIWFNSLRYLLQRNLDGINLYDMANEEDKELPSNAIYQLPGETSQSATRRLSNSRRASSSGVKKSTSKWSLRAN